MNKIGTIATKVITFLVWFMIIFWIIFFVVDFLVGHGYMLCPFCGPYK